MKIARQPRISASTRLNGAAPPFPAPSLRELSRPKGVTEGVSSDGCSMPMVYSQVFIGSEIFERLRATKYTPSVSHSLDSSLREGAGERPPQCQSPARWMFFQRAGDFCVGGICHSTGYLRNRGVTGDFHRPYEGSEGITLYHGKSPGRRGSGDWGLALG